VTTAVREAPHHNTLTCYTKYGCRRPECVERKNAWCRERDRAIREGAWQPRVDATPVRQHIRHLVAEGVTLDAIAASVGVQRDAIVDFTHKRRAGRGLRHTTNPELAEKILALTPEAITSGRVDATGSKRRIQALVAAGWPLLHIGRQFGMHEQRPEQILRYSRVYAATRQQVIDGYASICMLRPERRGVPKDKARQSRERGKANRWPTPDYWADRIDVIDDPHFEPMYGITRRLIVAQDANELMRYSGLDKTAAAERLGISVAYIEHAFRDHPEYAVEVAA